MEEKKKYVRKEHVDARVHLSRGASTRLNKIHFCA